MVQTAWNPFEVEEDSQGKKDSWMLHVGHFSP